MDKDSELNKVHIWAAVIIGVATIIAALISQGSINISNTNKVEIPPILEHTEIPTEEESLTLAQKEKCKKIRAKGRQLIKKLESKKNSSSLGSEKARYLQLLGKIEDIFMEKEDEDIIRELSIINNLFNEVTKALKSE